MTPKTLVVGADRLGHRLAKPTYLLFHRLAKPASSRL